MGEPVADDVLPRVPAQGGRSVPAVGAAVAGAQAAGRVRPGDPFDVMALVIAMSMAWSPVSNVYAATAQEPDEVHEQRRSLLRESVRRAVTAG